MDDNNDTGKTLAKTISSVMNASRSDAVASFSSAAFRSQSNMQPSRSVATVRYNRSETTQASPRPFRCNGCFSFDFPLLLDQGRLCDRKDNRTIHIVFLILTTHAARARRQAIRETWASFSRNNTSAFRHVFLLGAVDNSTLTRESEAENRQFGDMVMADFVDSYFNLTLKVMVGLKWAVSKCQHARYFLKADDDMWVNVPALLRLLRTHDAELQRGITGYCRLSPGVIRNNNSKWYVSRQYYPYERYPPYCKGQAYGGSLKVARDVVAVSPNVPFFFMEDVYIGFCLKELGYKVRHDRGFWKYASADNCMAKNSTSYVMHHVSIWRLRDYWNAKC